MLVAQCKVLCRPAHISIKTVGRDSSFAAKKDRLEYVKSSRKRSQIYRFSCSATQNFITRPAMVADIFEEFEPSFKKFLTAPLTGTIQILGTSTNRTERNTRIGKQLRSSDQTLSLVTSKATIQQLMDLVRKKIEFLYLVILF